MSKCYKLGIDIGSTTVKIAIIDEENRILFSDYKRHFANIQETLKDLLILAKEQLGSIEVHPVITGSGGLTLAGHMNVPFVQEVIAVSTALNDFAPQTDVAIELGGEDAKIIYFTNGVEQRMNGICAGGTGSFIDQMASLLQTDASGLNEYAKNYKAIYPIAARCENRYPAAHQRGCYKGRFIRFHFPGSGKPDHQRSCLRKTDSRKCCLSWRSAPLPVRIERGFYPHLETDTGAGHRPGTFPSLCSHRFCHELQKRGFFLR